MRDLAAFSPPRNFQPIEGPIAKVRKIDSPIHTKGRSTPAQRRGLRYEAKALDHLKALGPSFEPSPWFSFYEAGRHRFANPDGLWQIDRRVVIFEIKEHHTIDAWWQLRRLYEPLIRALIFSPVEVLVVEMCRSFDPAVLLPEDPLLIYDLKDLQPDRFNVFRWDPRYDL